jgi:hypothetical protein
MIPKSEGTLEWFRQSSFPEETPWLKYCLTGRFPTLETDEPLVIAVGNAH